MLCYPTVLHGLHDATSDVAVHARIYPPVAYRGDDEMKKSSHLAVYRGGKAALGRDPGGVISLKVSLNVTDPGADWALLHTTDHTLVPTPAGDKSIKLHQHFALAH